MVEPGLRSIHNTSLPSRWHSFVSLLPHKAILVVSTFDIEGNHRFESYKTGCSCLHNLSASAESGLLASKPIIVAAIHIISEDAECLHYD